MFYIQGRGGGGGGGGGGYTDNYERDGFTRMHDGVRFMVVTPALPSACV
jgi:hypothetical protein